MNMIFLLRWFLLAYLAVCLVLGVAGQIDYWQDAPYRAQYERCIDNGGGRLCEGLKTD